LGGETVSVPPVIPAAGAYEAQVPAIEAVPPPRGPTERLPLGTICGARSGDKGANANVGVWVNNWVAYAWLDRYLTTAKFQQLVPESATLKVERYPLPNLLGVNFVINGLLGEGVAGSTRSDPQAKSLGEYLRAKVVDIPRTLLAG